MSRICELTGKRPSYGNTVSHAKNRNRTRWELNLKHKHYHFEDLGRGVRLTLSTRAIRTIDKYGGITPALMNAKKDLLSKRLKKVRAQIYNKRVRACLPKKTG